MPSKVGGPGGGRGDRITMVGVMAAAAGLAAAGPRLRRRLAPTLGGPLADLVATGALTVTGWAMVALVERRRPYRSAWSVAADGEVAADVAFAVVAAPPAVAVATLISNRMRPSSARGLRSGGVAAAWPAEWPLAARVVLATGATELVHYWHHRLSHEWPLLWRFHAVHHSSTRLYWTNSGRFHPVDLVPLLTLQLVAVRVLGVDDDAFIAMQIFKGIHGQIQHSNIRLDTRGFDPVFSTAAQHRWHHASSQGGGACNYGGVSSLFDRLFGTQVLPTDREVGAVGVTDATGSPAGFIDLLRGPLAASVAAVRG